MNTKKIRLYLDDSDFELESFPVKFTLTYEGELKTSSSRKAERKQRIRQGFHKQLKRLWEVNPLLANWNIVVDKDEFYRSTYEDAGKWLTKYDRILKNYVYTPIVVEELCVECAIEFRVLRPTHTVGQISDIDNQLKVLLDCLKMPQDLNELGKCPEAQGDEPEKIICLLEDDRLVTRISSINDELLQPILGKDDIDTPDVRVMIDVHIRPKVPLDNNAIFFSGESPVWDEKYTDKIPHGLPSMSDSELRAIATQCVFRIKALDSLRSSMQYADYHHADYMARYEEQHKLLKELWHSELWPVAHALRKELIKRIGSDSKEHRSSIAIDHGSLAGVSPLADAALEIEGLILGLV